jgi:hypothetical protein
VKFDGLAGVDFAQMRFDYGSGKLDPQDLIDAEDSFQQIRPEPLHPPEIRESIVRVNGLGLQLDGIGNRPTHCQPKSFLTQHRGHRSEVFLIGHGRAFAHHATPLPPIPAPLATQFLDASHQEQDR